jgi:hypothetical protein
MRYPQHVLEAQPRVSKPVRPRRPQPRRVVAPDFPSRRRPLPTYTRDHRRARASDKRLRAVGPAMRTAAVGSAGRRVVGAPPSLHLECLEARGATRHRTSTPSIPLVLVTVVPEASSVQMFNVAITSTATRPADGSAIARSRVDAMPREGGRG